MFQRPSPWHLPPGWLPAMAQGQEPLPASVKQWRDGNGQPGEWPRPAAKGAGDPLDGKDGGHGDIMAMLTTFTQTSNT